MIDKIPRSAESPLINKVDGSERLKPELEVEKPSCRKNLIELIKLSRCNQSHLDFVLTLTSTSTTALDRQRVARTCRAQSGQF